MKVIDLFNAKYKINEKVKCFGHIGVVIDAKLHEDLGVLYLVKYEDDVKLWEYECMLEKEDKKIEKLDDNIAYYSGTFETRWNDSEQYIVNKINEIIDKINEE